MSKSPAARWRRCMLKWLCLLAGSFGTARSAAAAPPESLGRQRPRSTASIAVEIRPRSIMQSRSSEQQWQQPSTIVEVSTVTTKVTVKAVARPARPAREERRAVWELGGRLKRRPPKPPSFGHGREGRVLGGRLKRRPPQISWPDLPEQERAHSSGVSYKHQVQGPGTSKTVKTPSRSSHHHGYDQASGDGVEISVGGVTPMVRGWVQGKVENISTAQESPQHWRTCKEHITTPATPLPALETALAEGARANSNQLGAQWMAGT